MKRSFFIITKLIIVLLVLTNILIPIVPKAEVNMSGEDRTENEYYERVLKIYNELLENGSSVNLMVFAGTVHMSMDYANMTYQQFDEDMIRQIFKYMNSDPFIEDDEAIFYNEESFRKNIREYWIDGDYFSKADYSESKKDALVDEIYTNIDVYQYLFGVEDIPSGEGGVCSYNVGSNKVSNVKVRLVHCEGSGPIESEELVDFEEYIIGVVSQENGGAPYEALKAQAVAARSYALTRAKAMNNANGVSIKQENGSWILSLRSCTNDQAFCNPTKGCWSNVPGGQTDTTKPEEYKNCTIYSGYDPSKEWSRPPLAEDSLVRKAVEETRGQVLVDKNGKVVYTPYQSTKQNRWKSMANEGKDYFEILKKEYDDASTISSNCTSKVVSEAEKWKQNDEAWGSKLIGNKTIAEVGCMLTSTSIQIARSGTQLNVADFDPGVFVDTVKKNNGLSGNNFNVNDASWASIAPNFKVGGAVSFSGSKQEKINKMKQYTTGNNYLIIRLFHPGQHWVAVTHIEGDKIIMADPGSESTDFTSKYSIATVTQGYYFVKKD